MSYIPEWELLSDAVVRLVKSGVAESEARQQLAAAIADRAINIQVWLTELLTSSPCMRAVQIPPELTEADFDWAQSRPSRRWWFPETFNPGLSKPKNVDRLKVSTRDLVRVFGLERASPSLRSEQLHKRPSDPKNRSFQAVPDRTRERPKAWNAADERHFEAMKKLLDDGKALSVADAARQLVEAGAVIGRGTIESRRKRLERGYREYAKSAN